MTDQNFEIRSAFGSSLGQTESKLDTSSCVQESYSISRYIERIFREDFELKKHFKTKYLPSPIEPKVTVSKL